MEKEELKKKNEDLIREHAFLSSKINKLQEELKKKSELEKNFNREIDELNQETENLVNEIENGKCKYKI